MKAIIRIGFIVISMILIFGFSWERKANINEKPDYVVVIHGGAGSIYKGRYSEKQEKEYIVKLTEALLKGKEILENGGSSLDAVESVINILEDDPLFNAGKGAVFNEKGKNEMDASIMNGKTLEAGAVAGVHTIKNPVSAARKVMTHSKHVLLVGEGAEKFAESQGLQIEDPSYFFDQKKWDFYLKYKEKSKGAYINMDEKYGTVGAVAMDKEGNLAAGTSTGGMTYKMVGRIGDSPIIGAGTYADNNTCAVSATGHGEFFIRNVVAYDISALMKYREWPLEKAADFVINEKLKSMEGFGGIIAVDKDGHIAMPFNTKGMFRGYVSSDEEVLVELYGED
ncbi:isoaspartyl peptidase/L-asparaginase family protein [candidate division KSB1 bacterium]